MNPDPDLSGSGSESGSGLFSEVGSGPNPQHCFRSTQDISCLYQSVVFLKKNFGKYTDNLHKNYRKKYFMQIR
jgi:hypothetical protein